MAEFRGFEQRLLQDAVLDASKLERAKAEADKTGLPLTEVISQLGLATPETVYQSLARFCELPYAQPSQGILSPAVAALVPARFATHYRFVPVEERNGALVAAISDPLNTHLLDDLRLVLKRRVEPVVATPGEIQKAIKALYGVGADTLERMLFQDELAGDTVSLDTAQITADLGDVSIDASIIKFVNELILEAVQSNTTDIHIEPFEDQLRVRYRIDGVLHQVPVPASVRGFHAAIVSRIKVMANLNIAERRLPQDGKILASFGRDHYDLRVSVLPTPHGETVNLRVLNRASLLFSLEQLGFYPEDRKLFETFILKPHGIILVTGPTGSGKTTTLYAALQKLNQLDRKIITLEDPIEYQLNGITQMQVQPRIGFDFASGLRAMLRHDPDIMLVGEIRDYETAEMAIRSSLTGHLVLSTLHTNDAAGAVTRLTDMGVEPFLIASTLLASMAQRLVRRVCQDCAAEASADPLVLREEFGVTPEDCAHLRFVRGSGCESCRHTGYRGRIAIYEIMAFSPEIKELTVQRATAHQIKRKALEQGMLGLRTAGWRRIQEGTTTIEEVLRVTADAEVMGTPVSRQP